ncbi:MAG: hypothetical protein ACLQVN_00670, partial [Bryobacteraceae bacterium]
MRKRRLLWKTEEILTAHGGVSPTFAVRRLFAPRPNYIWFVCNNDPGENAEKGLSEDLPSFLAA